MKTFENAIQFLFDNTGLIWEKTVEHVWLSLASLGVAIVIAVPVGVWLGHRHRGSFLAINVSNIGRALPSLAVISIGLGLLGVGFTNVMTALVILAAPVMLTNAYVAVDRVDQDAVVAAVAMGMKGWQVLMRVELPLALPLMFAGIRTAAVYVVATAPLAALAGGGGLGDIIVNQPTYGPEGVVAGSLAIAALAFLTEGVFALLQYAVTPRPHAATREAASARAEGGNGRGMRDQTEGVQRRSPMRRRKIQTPMLMVLLLAVLAVFGLAACGGDDDSSSSSTSESSSSSSDQPGKGKPAVTLGTKDFTEEFVLGELYKQALEAKGYTVKLKKNIGSTEIIDKALTSGQIDGYPEYLGVSVAVVAGKDIIPKSDQETYDLAKQFYEGRGQTISQQTPFFDVDAIATTKDFATKNGLKTVADLKKLDSFTVGARPEFKSRYQGLRGMQKVYGLTEREVQAARARHPVPGARQRGRGRGERVLDGRPARERQVHGARGPEGDLRLPARGDGHRPEEEGRPRAGVLRDHRRRVKLLDERRDDLDEQGRRRSTSRSRPSVAKKFLQANGML